MLTIKKAVMIVLLATAIFSCEKDTVITPHRTESINKMVLSFTSIDSTESFIFNFPKIDTLPLPQLKPNAAYTTRITVYKTTPDSIYDITPEIIKEAEQHQFFYDTNGTALEITYADKDKNEHPIGLQTVFTTKNSGTNSLKIKLIHIPLKSAKNVILNDPTHAGGILDFEAIFEINTK